MNYEKLMDDAGKQDAQLKLEAAAIHIKNAFDWHHSQEGHSFWAEVHRTLTQKAETFRKLLRRYPEPVYIGTVRVERGTSGLIQVGMSGPTAVQVLTVERAKKLIEALQAQIDADVS
jgi:hypothetical protein